MMSSLTQGPRARTGFSHLPSLFLSQEIYERAIANIPPSKNKRHWRRYIYLWINYALWCELECEDPERTEQVYKWCLEIIPHKVFTFAKIWLLYAQWAVRQKNLGLARKILGEIADRDRAASAFLFPVSFRSLSLLTVQARGGRQTQNCTLSFLYCHLCFYHCYCLFIYTRSIFS